MYAALPTGSIVEKGYSRKSATLAIMTFVSDPFLPHWNFWVERSGQVVLSMWRAELLEAIAETGSISAAADRLGVPYHRAWDRLQEMERGLGVTLVERQVGGSGGGGARLSAEGQRYLERFRAFAQGIEEIVNARFREAFGAGPDAQAPPGDLSPRLPAPESSSGE
jgi:molybdate transport system regulatory protein